MKFSFHVFLFANLMVGCTVYDKDGAKTTNLPMSPSTTPTPTPPPTASPTPTASSTPTPTSTPTPASTPTPTSTPTPDPTTTLYFLEAGGALLRAQFNETTQALTLTALTPAAAAPGALTVKGMPDAREDIAVGALCISGDTCPNPRLVDTARIGTNTYFVSSSGEIIGSTGTVVASHPRLVSIAIVQGVHYGLLNDGSVLRTADANFQNFVPIPGLLLRRARRLASGPR